MTSQTDSTSSTTVPPSFFAKVVSVTEAPKSDGAAEKLKSFIPAGAIKLSVVLVVSVTAMPTTDGSEFGLGEGRDEGVTTWRIVRGLDDFQWLESELVADNPEAVIPICPSAPANKLTEGVASIGNSIGGSSSPITELVEIQLQLSEMLRLICRHTRLHTHSSLKVFLEGKQWVLAVERENSIKKRKGSDNDDGFFSGIAGKAMSIGSATTGFVSSSIDSMKDGATPNDTMFAELRMEQTALSTYDDRTKKVLKASEKLGQKLKETSDCVGELAAAYREYAESSQGLIGDDGARLQIVYETDELRTLQNQYVSEAIYVAGQFCQVVKTNHQNGAACNRALNHRQTLTKQYEDAVATLKSREKDLAKYLEESEKEKQGQGSFFRGLSAKIGGHTAADNAAATRNAIVTATENVAKTKALWEDGSKTAFAEIRAYRTHSVEDLSAALTALIHFEKELRAGFSSGKDVNAL